MTAYGAIVLEHFRHPRNHGPLAEATGRADGSNPLCGDRVRIEVRVEDDIVCEAAFTANACAICTASASLLTTRVANLSTDAALRLTDAEIARWLETDVPPGRRACVALPLRILRSALGAPAE